MGRGRPPCSLTVVLKSRLFCSLNPESPLCSALPDLSLQTGGGRGTFAFAWTLFPCCLACSVWLSPARLRADICSVLLRFRGRGQRQLDVRGLWPWRGWRFSQEAGGGCACPPRKRPPRGTAAFCGSARADPLTKHRKNTGFPAKRD